MLINVGYSVFVEDEDILCVLPWGTRTKRIWSKASKAGMTIDVIPYAHKGTQARALLWLVKGGVERYMKVVLTPAELANRKRKALTRYAWREQEEPPEGPFTEENFREEEI